MADDKQTNRSPVEAARMMEQAARAERIANLLRDADLAEAGLPPEGLALIGGGPMATWTDAQIVAAWMAGVMERAGLADPAGTFFANRLSRVKQQQDPHVWHQHERAARALARRIVAAMEREDTDAEAADGER